MYHINRTKIKTNKVNLHFRRVLRTFSKLLQKISIVNSDFFSLNCLTLYMYANSFVETFTIHQGIGDNGVADARLEHTIKTLKTACMIVFFLMFFFF